MTAAERAKRREDKIKRQREIEDRMWEILMNPNVIRSLMVGTLLFGARAIRDSSASPSTKAIAVATATVGVPMIAADAGIRDRWALAAIAGIVGGLTGIESIWNAEKGDIVLADIGGQDLTVGEMLLGAGSGGTPVWFNPFGK